MTEPKAELESVCVQACEVKDTRGQISAIQSLFKQRDQLTRLSSPVKSLTSLLQALAGAHIGEELYSFRGQLAAVCHLLLELVLARLCDPNLKKSSLLDPQTRQQWLQSLTTAQQRDRDSRQDPSCTFEIEALLAGVKGLEVLEQDKDRFIKAVKFGAQFVQAGAQAFAGKFFSRHISVCQLLTGVTGSFSAMANLVAELGMKSYEALSRRSDLRVYQQILWFRRMGDILSSSKTPAAAADVAAFCKTFSELPRAYALTCDWRVIACGLFALQSILNRPNLDGKSQMVVCEALVHERVTMMKEPRVQLIVADICLKLICEPQAQWNSQVVQLLRLKLDNLREGTWAIRLFERV